MPAGSAELTNSRKNEILNACEQLYKTLGFREITLKEIGQVTSFSRPSIYNYFKTKEEIFLGLLIREYELWNDDIKVILAENDVLSKDELASKIALSLSKRENLLKISAMNLYEIEDTSSLEMLTEFKIAFKGVYDELCSCLDRFLPEFSDEKQQLIQFSFFPFLFGIYPYTHPTEKQLMAMQNVGIKFEAGTIYEMTYGFLLRLFK